jgi:hypothetical protein
LLADSSVAASYRMAGFNSAAIEIRSGCGRPVSSE